MMNSSHSVIAMRDWTRQWWDKHSKDYSLVTSTAVFDELREETNPHKQTALELALSLPAVEPTSQIEGIMQVYFKHHLMPRDPFEMHYTLL